MAKFRKKPVVIEAVQFDGTAGGAVVVFNSFDESDMPDAKFSPSADVKVGTLSIPTLEGVMTADKGDWIIKGVAGEFYPCKPAIFAATYEEVTE